MEDNEIIKNEEHPEETIISTPEDSINTNVLEESSNHIDDSNVESENSEELDEEIEEEEKPKLTKEQVEEMFENENKAKKKLILLAGTIFLLLAIFISVYYFFFYRLNLQTNISTDKKIEFKQINGKKEQITTQMYVSELNYTMRYDIANFKAFSYRNQDIYKGIKNEDILIVIENSTVPSACSNSTTNPKSTYNQCEIIIDINTTEYYMYNKNNAYKITVNLPPLIEDQNHFDERIDLMLNTFKMET